MARTLLAEASMSLVPLLRVEGSLTLQDLFARGPIEIMLLGADGRRFKLGISAPRELGIWRKDNDI